MVSFAPHIRFCFHICKLISSREALTHPSQPNYIASVGGDYFGLNVDSPVNIPRYDVFNISSQAEPCAAMSLPSLICWRTRAFRGGPISRVCLTRDILLKRGINYITENTIPWYALIACKFSLWCVKVSYQSVAANETHLAHIKNLTMFYTDLESGSLPQVATSCMCSLLIF